MTIYFGVITFIFGLIFGSFLNCMAMRIARKEDWVKGKSHCIKCGHELSAIDLVPLVSFLSTGGRCRYCKGKISSRYPVTEFTFALLAVVMYQALLARAISDHFMTLDSEQLFPAMILFIRNMILTGALFVAALVDIEIMEIPDGCIICGTIAWIFTAGFCYKEASKVLHHLLAAVIMFAGIMLITLLMEKILQKEALGGGDIKLLTMLALYLGYAGSYELILFSSILGLVFAAVRRISDPGAGKEFPFGPAIALSGYLLLICADKITSWYMGFFI